MLENILYAIMLFFCLLAAFLLYSEHTTFKNIWQMIIVCAMLSLLYFNQRNDYGQIQEQSRQIRVLKKEMRGKVNRKVILQCTDGQYLIVEKYGHSRFVQEVKTKKYATVFAGKEIKEANKLSRELGVQVVELR